MTTVLIDRLTCCGATRLFDSKLRISEIVHHTIYSHYSIGAVIRIVVVLERVDTQHCHSSATKGGLVSVILKP